MATISGIPVGQSNPITVSFSNDRIDSIIPGGRPDRLLAPGLVDIHCHGGGGAQFNRGGGAQFNRGGGAQFSRGGAAQAAEFHHRRGTTSVMGSLVSASPERMREGVGALAPLVASGLIVGIHLEGPYLALACCGAHDPDVLRLPDVDELRALHAIAPLSMVTYAPELSGADELLSVMLELGIRPAVGHTAARAAISGAHLEHAAEAGAGPVVTHLFNGMPPFHHRDPGTAGAGLAMAASGRAVAEIIADGVHLDPQTVSLTFAAAPDNTVLISDSTAAAGLGDGVHDFEGRAVEVRGRRSVIAGTDSIAGSVITSLDAVRFAVESGVAPDLAFAAASRRPADLLGRDDLGRIEIGARADLLELTQDLTLRRVWRGGEALDPV